MPFHSVSVTISDPSQSVKERQKETTTKTVKVKATDAMQAKKKAQAYYEKLKYKVHDTNHTGLVKEEAMTDKIADSITERILTKIMDGYYTVSQKKDGTRVKTALPDQREPKTRVGKFLNNMTNKSLGIYKEEVEPVEEISKDLLKRYVEKGDKSLDNLENRAARAWKSNDDLPLKQKMDRALALGKKADSRAQYLNKAASLANRIKEGSNSPDSPEDEKNADETAEVEVKSMKGKSSKKDKSNKPDPASKVQELADLIQGKLFKS